ncbi:MAG: hypothetical protein ABIZ80_04805 [Bryobacteraceae bacterium]
MKRSRLALFALVLSLGSGTTPDYLSARRKLDLIEQDKLRPGTRVVLSQRELNAWVQTDIAQMAPQGVRDMRLELGQGSASGSALIDFLKVRQAQGKAPGWLAAKLLAGERPVRVTTRIQSGGGRATVDVERVEVSGILVEGRLLEFLIQNYLTPNYPDAKIGKPFELGHRIDRLELAPASVGVFIR